MEFNPDARRVVADVNIVGDKIEAILRLPNGHEYVYENGALMFAEASDAAGLIPIDPLHVHDDDAEAVTPWLEALGIIPTPPPAPETPYWLAALTTYVTALSALAMAIVQLALLGLGAGTLVGWLMK